MLSSEPDSSELTYIVDTHCHADHVTGAMDLKEKTNAFYMASERAGIECLDQSLEDGDKIELGAVTLNILATPGHTEGCISILCGSDLFTGDALFIRGCGRTDFQQGSSKALFESVREKLFTLPDSTTVWPGHDYRGMTSSTIEEEKKWNPRLNMDMTLNDFETLMSELNLDYPKKIDEALPKNIKGGL